MGDPHRYSIWPLNPEAHLFEVRLTVAHPGEAGQIFAMPAWIPGSYMIRDYARHVVGIRAEADGVGLAVTKLDKSRWQTAPTDRQVTLVLEIYAHDDSVRGAHLDNTHAYFNGPCVFPAVVGQEDIACQLEIGGADLPQAKNWRVATSMNRAGAESYGFGAYVADDYAELIDHPVEISTLSIGEFQAGGIPHVIAIRGKTKAAAIWIDTSSCCTRPAAVTAGWNIAGHQVLFRTATAFLFVVMRGYPRNTVLSWVSSAMSISIYGM